MTHTQPGESQIAADVLFGEATAPRLTRDLLLRLFAGTLGAITVTNALPVALSSSFLAQLDPSLFGGYASDRYQLPATRLGPVINEFRGDGDVGESYWQKANSTANYWSSRPRAVNLRNTAMELVQSAWQAPVVPASTHGRDLFWGIVREINSGTLIHWDEVIREYPVDFLDRMPVAQLALNIFLSVPDQGGETAIWRKRWEPKDEIYRTGFGYRSESVREKPRLLVAPKRGDVMLFDSRNFHAVQNSTEGRRIALSFFIGLAGDGNLIVWS